LSSRARSKHFAIASGGHGPRHAHRELTEGYARVITARPDDQRQPTRRLRTALQVIGIAIVSAASIALHLFLLDTLLGRLFQPHNEFGRWDLRDFVLVQDTLVGRVGIHAAQPGTLRDEVVYDDAIAFRIVRAHYISHATPEELRIDDVARCIASRLHPLQNEEIAANGDKAFSCARTVADAADSDLYPLVVTIHASMPTRVTLLAVTPLDD
jgi:hypothetical protein